MLQLRLKSFLQFGIEHIEMRLVMFYVTTFLFSVSVFILALRKLNRTRIFLDTSK